MIFSRPIPFAEALDSRRVRSILPTRFRTATLERLAPQLRERAVFSAGVIHAELLQKIDDSVRELIGGEIDQATKRLEIKNLLTRIGYRPRIGEADTILDLSSDERINLQLETNRRLAEGFGSWQQGQDEVVLDEWPAQELFRAESRQEPRNWPSRWRGAGGGFYGGRMIALKNAPVWTAISRFGLPYPPFDFNSGMDVRDVARDEAVRLGLIDADTRVEPQTRGFNDDLAVSPSVRSAALRSALESTGLGRFDPEGIFRKAVP